LGIGLERKIVIYVPIYAFNLGKNIKEKLPNKYCPLNDLREIIFIPTQTFTQIVMSLCPQGVTQSVEGTS
jgi:hypothetical protein